jgi:hypothetical protein
MDTDTYFGSGATRDDALAAARAAAPEGAPILGTHWIHLPGHTDPALRWHVVLVLGGRAARALAALDALPHSATLAYNRVSGVWVLSGAPGRRVGRTAVGALIGEEGEGG